MIAADRHARFVTSRRGACALLAGVLLAAIGCKSRDGGIASGPGKGPDPLVAGPGRIPKQNLPVPDRGLAGGSGGKSKPDPLLGSPTGKTGSGYTDDPDRWKGGPFVPNAATTPAALSGRTKEDGEGLKIDNPGGVTLQPTGGTFPPDGPDAKSSAAVEPLLAELAKYGVKRGNYTLARLNGEFVFDVLVQRKDGTNHSYSGKGPTAADAVQQVLTQIKSDWK